MWFSGRLPGTITRAEHCKQSGWCAGARLLPAGKCPMCCTAFTPESRERIPRLSDVGKLPTWQRTGRRQCKWCSLLPISPVTMQQGERLARLQTRSWHKLQPTNRCHSRTVITCCLSIIVVLTATLHTRTVLQSLVLFLRYFITMSPDCSSCTLDHATKQRR